MFALGVAEIEFWESARKTCWNLCIFYKLAFIAKVVGDKNDESYTKVATDRHLGKWSRLAPRSTLNNKALLK